MFPSKLIGEDNDSEFLDLSNVLGTTVVIKKCASDATFIYPPAPQHGHYSVAAAGCVRSLGCLLFPLKTRKKNHFHWAPLWVGMGGNR